MLLCIFKTDKAVPLFAKCSFAVVKDLPNTMQRSHFVHVREFKMGQDPENNAFKTDGVHGAETAACNKNLCAIVFFLKQHIIKDPFPSLSSI